MPAPGGKRNGCASCLSGSWLSAGGGGGGVGGGGCERSFWSREALIQIGAKRGIRMGAVGPDATTGTRATVAEQDTHRHPQKPAAALRIHAHRCHIAHLFRRSKKSRFSGERPPAKHICGLVQSKVAAWGPCAGVGSLPASLLYKEGLPVIKRRVLLLQELIRV